MALFKSTPKKDTEKPAAVAAPKAPKVQKEAAASSVSAPSVTRVLLSARITEKATDLAAHNVYVFNVALTANKRQVIEAVRALYKVIPQSVRMVSVPRKTVRHPRRGVSGVSKLGKKAYVHLKKGDTISLN